MGQEITINSLQPTKRSYPLVKREVIVQSVAQLSPSFLSIVFTSEALSGFQSASFDDHIKFFFEDDDGNLLGRHYTVRNFDRSKKKLTLEFGLHSDGPAARWARSARIGSKASIGGPKGSHIIPFEYDWHFLVGDSTALPAIQRRLEELPRESKAIAVLYVENPSDIRPIETEANARIHWLHSPSAFIDQIRSTTLPEGQGYVWCAAEADLVKQVHSYFSNDKDHPESQASFKAYWREGETDNH